MKQSEYALTLSALWAYAWIIARIPVEEALEAAQRADSIGWVLDPTAARANGKKLEQDVKLLAAMATVKSLMAEFAAKEGKQP